MVLNGEQGRADPATVPGQTRPRDAGAHAGDRLGDHLGDHAAALYADLRSSPFLRELLSRSSGEMDTSAGSISLVDARTGRYHKAAELGMPCQLGQSFPLEEGITGQVLAHRRPVVLGAYGAVRSSHLPPGHPAHRQPVAAVPIWWRGEVLGVNVAFAGSARSFTTQQVDRLETLSQLAAAGIVESGFSDPALAPLVRQAAGHREDPRGSATPRVVTSVNEIGRSRSVVCPTAARVALDLVALAEDAALTLQPDTRLHVVVVHHERGHRLLVHDRHPSDQLGVAPVVEGTWRELLDTSGGTVVVEPVPGRGTMLYADLTDVEADLPALADAPEPAPFTGREHEVLTMLARGAGDRAIAEALVISPRTVEKHVSAVLRKTGTTSRTAAVMCCVAKGWLTAR